MKTFRISHSSLNAFRSCPQAFKYSYVDNLESNTDKWKSTKDLGTCVHAGISAVIEEFAHRWIPVEEQVSIGVAEAISTHESLTLDNKQNWHGDRDDEYYQKMQVNRELLPQLMEMYIPMLQLGVKYRPVWASEFFEAAGEVEDIKEDVGIGEITVAQVSHDYVLTEFEFEVEDVNGDVTTTVEGIIDAVLFDTDTEQYVMFDWKVRGRLLDPNAAQMDAQLPLYATVLNSIADTGARVELAVMFQMLNTPPKPASLTQKGIPSKAKAASYWDYWWNSIPDPIRKKLDMDEWFDIMVTGGKLRNRNDWVGEIEYHIIPPLEVATSEMVELTIEEIHRAVENDKWLRRYSSHGCEYCQFKQLCQQKLQGGSEEYVKDNFYRQRDAYWDTTEDDES